jgi:hypothetical protein
MWFALLAARMQAPRLYGWRATNSSKDVEQQEVGSVRRQNPALPTFRLSSFLGFSHHSCI